MLVGPVTHVGGSSHAREQRVVRVGMGSGEARLGTNGLCTLIGREPGG